MATAIVRVDSKVHDRLREISEESHRPIGQIVRDLVERFDKEEFWKGVQEDYKRLHADPVAWKEYQDEAAPWESSTGNTMADEPPYYTPEEEEEIRAEYARTFGRGDLERGARSAGGS